MKLAAYNNTNAALLFIPLILYFEGDVLSEYSYLLTSWYYWFLMTVGGVCGFAIGIVTMLQIQVCPAVPPPVRVRVWVCVDVGVWLSCGRAPQETSPLTHNISGTAKAGLQTVIALLYYRNPVTAGSIAGNVLVIGGSAAYAAVKNRENRK